MLHWPTETRFPPRRLKAPRRQSLHYREVERGADTVESLSPVRGIGHSEQHGGDARGDENQPSRLAIPTLENELGQCGSDKHRLAESKRRGEREGDRRPSPGRIVPPLERCERTEHEDRGDGPRQFGAAERDTQLGRRKEPCGQDGQTGCVRPEPAPYQPHQPDADSRQHRHHEAPGEDKGAHIVHSHLVRDVLGWKHDAEWEDGTAEVPNGPGLMQ